MADQKTIPEFDTDVEVIENADFATYDRGTAENPDTTEGTTEPTTANEGVEDTLADQDVIEIDNTEREEDDGPITVEASVSDPTEQTVSEDVTDATVHESSESVLGNAAAFLLSTEIRGEDSACGCVRVSCWFLRPGLRFRKR